ncbi:MAG: hypothetical protein GY842_22730, partial [bacterium]|nr:hypothetical protein [bacterium]
MPESHRTLYVVLARGGSKRLPGKNVALVGGVPLVGRAVRAGLRSARCLGAPARVVVSTDNEAIAAAGREWGGEVPFVRPGELSTDTADSLSALRHVVDWFTGSGETFSEVVLLQPTSPLRSAEDVVGAVQAFRAGAGAPVVTVARSSQHPDAPHYELDRARLANPTDQHEEGVALNGAVYVCSPDWLRGARSFYEPGRTIAASMPEARSVDVDTAADLHAAQVCWEASLLWRPGRCFVIAEAGVNHNGSVETAGRLIDAAREAGADAVKFQTFAAERLVTSSAGKAAYQQATTPPAESQLEMLRRLELSPDDHRALTAYCAERDMVFLSTPFGVPEVDLLEGLDVPALKLGSGEVTNHPLLAHAAATLRPVILSTGGSSLEEVEAAVDVLRGAGCAELALLHCVSNYPAAPADANLRAMATMANAFDLPVGYSDHTPGVEVAWAAVALGARIIEKHLTLDRTAPGPDHRASL